MIRLKDALEIAGVSQGKLARSIGMTQPAVHFIVKTGSTNLETAIAIAKELGYSLDWLCGLDDVNNTSRIDNRTCDRVYDKKVLKLKERLHKFIDKA